MLTLVFENFIVVCEDNFVLMPAVDPHRSITVARWYMFPPPSIHSLPPCVVLRAGKQV